ncbi:hypothetical protein ACI65C_004389 [Semiaphis heraclei]
MSKNRKTHDNRQSLMERRGCSFFYLVRIFITNVLKRFEHQPVSLPPSMPNKYNRTVGSRLYKNYTEHTLQRCLLAVKTKQMTQREAEKKPSKFLGEQSLTN